jgi:hypothetical protein
MLFGIFRPGVDLVFCQVHNTTGNILLKNTIAAMFDEAYRESFYTAAREPAGIFTGGLGI